MLEPGGLVETPGDAAGRAAFAAAPADVLPGRVLEAARAGRLVKGQVEHDRGSVVQVLHGLGVQRLAIDAHPVQPTGKVIAPAAWGVTAAHAKGLRVAVGGQAGKRRGVCIRQGAVDVQGERAALVVKGQRDVIPGPLGQHVAALIVAGPFIAGAKAEAYPAAHALQGGIGRDVVGRHAQNGLRGVVAGMGIDPGRDAELALAQVEAGVRPDVQAGGGAVEAGGSTGYAVAARGALARCGVGTLAVVTKDGMIRPASVLVEAQVQHRLVEEGTNLCRAQAVIVDAHLVEVTVKIGNQGVPRVADGQMPPVGVHPAGFPLRNEDAIDVQLLPVQAVAKGVHDVMPLAVGVGLVGADHLGLGGAAPPQEIVGAQIAVLEIELRAVAVLHRRQAPVAVAAAPLEPQGQRVARFRRVEISADVARGQAHRAAVTSNVLSYCAFAAHTDAVVGRQIAGLVRKGRGPFRVLEGQPEQRAAREGAPVDDGRARGLGQAVRAAFGQAIHLHLPGHHLLFLGVEDETGGRDGAGVDVAREVGIQQALGVAIVELILERGLVGEGVVRADEAIRFGVAARVIFPDHRFHAQHGVVGGPVGVQSIDLFLEVGQGVAISVDQEGIRRDPGAQARAAGREAVDEFPSQHLIGIGQPVAVGIGARGGGSQTELLVVVQAVAIGVDHSGIAADLVLDQVGEAIAVGVPTGVVGVGVIDETIDIGVVEAGEAFVPGQLVTPPAGRQEGQFV